MSEYITQYYGSANGGTYTERREEIVRCRDCKYYIDSDLFYSPFCSFLNDHDTQPDGFCAWGERNGS